MRHKTNKYGKNSKKTTNLHKKHLSTFNIYVRIDISGILLIFSKTWEEINMDSEKIIVELIKPLLKDYLAFTRGQVPKDWVNVRDERQAYIERLQREINELKGDIKKAEEFNTYIEKNAVPSLKRRKPGMVDELEADIKENKEKIESYPKRIEMLEEEQKRAKEELEEAKAQIETRRQAEITKIKKNIHNKVRQYIERQAEEGEKQENIEALKKYEKLSDEEIQSFASRVEKEEKRKLKATKIAKIKQDIESKEEKYKDLLTEDYYRAKEEYIECLEAARIEKIEEKQEAIGSITVTTIYQKAYKDAVKENDQTRADAILEKMQEVKNRKQKEIERNGLEENAQREKVQSQKGNIVTNFIQGSMKALKSMVSVFPKLKEMINRTTRRLNYFGIERLGAGKENITMTNEQINESMQKNRAKYERFLEENREKRQKEQSENAVLAGEQDLQGNVILSREEEIEKQLKEEKELRKVRFVHDTDYVNEMRQRVSEVKIITNEELEKKYAAYRKANGIDKAAVEARQEKQGVKSSLMENREIHVENIPEFLKNDGTAKNLDTKISKEKSRKTIGGFSWISGLVFKVKGQKVAVQNQNGNAYKQGLDAGISQEEQRRRAKLFQTKKDLSKENPSKENTEFRGVLYGGE